MKPAAGSSKYLLSPGPDVAVYYRAGGPAIPDPGVVLLARLDSGVRAFNMPGTVRVRPGAHQMNAAHEEVEP